MFSLITFLDEKYKLESELGHFPIVNSINNDQIEQSDLRITFIEILYGSLPKAREEISFWTVWNKSLNTSIECRAFLQFAISWNELNDKSTFKHERNEKAREHEEPEKKSLNTIFSFLFRIDRIVSNSHTSTPRYPQGSMDGKKWKMTTATTAHARTPCNYHINDQ